jgi:hypothetical protein
MMPPKRPLSPPPVYRPAHPTSILQPIRSAPAPAGLIRSGAPSWHPVSAAAMPRYNRKTIQLARRFPTSGVNPGSGLTPDTPSPYGRYHMHVIRDQEGLGLIDIVFIRFVERPGAQHLAYDDEGNVYTRFPQTALQRSNQIALKNFAQGKVKQLLAACTLLSDLDVQRLREEKAQQEEARMLAMQSLPALKPPEKFTGATGKQKSLYESMSTGDTEKKQQIALLLEKLGIDPGDDRNYVLTQLAKGIRSAEWRFAKDIGAQIEAQIKRMKGEEEMRAQLQRQREEALAHLDEEPEEVERKGGSWSPYWWGLAGLGAIAYGIGAWAGYLPPIMMKKAGGMTPPRPPAPPPYKPAAASTPKIAPKGAPKTAMIQAKMQPPPVYRPFPAETLKSAAAPPVFRPQTAAARLSPRSPSKVRCHFQNDGSLKFGRNSV